VVGRAPPPFRLAVHAQQDNEEITGSESWDCADEVRTADTPIVSIPGDDRVLTLAATTTTTNERAGGRARKFACPSRSRAMRVSIISTGAPFNNHPHEKNSGAYHVGRRKRPIPGRDFVFRSTGHCRSSTRTARCTVDTVYGTRKPRPNCAPVNVSTFDTAGIPSPIAGETETVWSGPYHTEWDGVPVTQHCGESAAVVAAAVL
jgi:hypothetical protein